MNKLTTFGKIAVTVAIIGALVGAKWLIMDSGLIMKKKVKQSEEIGKIDLPTAPANASSTVSAVEMPSDNPANINSKEVRALIWAWNSQMGLLFANGGANTTEGSLMAKQGVNLHLTRQDDVSQMQASLIKFAKEYKDNPDTKEGAQFVAIMGDGSAAFLAGVNPELEKLGKDY